MQNELTVTTANISKRELKARNQKIMFSAFRSNARRLICRTQTLRELASSEPTRQQCHELQCFFSFSTERKPLSIQKGKHEAADNFKARAHGARMNL